MNKLIARIGIVAGSVMTAGMILAPVAGAADCTISGNGANSRNRCRISINKTTTVVQQNWSRINNTVVVSSNTGGNDANNNTGGNVTSDSGNSNVNITITNTTGGNTINP